MVRVVIGRTYTEAVYPLLIRITISPMIIHQGPESRSGQELDSHYFNAFVTAVRQKVVVFWISVGKEGGPVDHSCFAAGRRDRESSG